MTATALKWRMVALGGSIRRRQRLFQMQPCAITGIETTLGTPRRRYSPSRFLEVIALAIEQGQISVRRAADVLDLSIEDLAELCTTHGVEAAFDL